MVMDDDSKHFCRFEYKFLDNFCYLCGIIGHIDRECEKGDWKAKEKPYGNELCVILDRKWLNEEGWSRGFDRGRGNNLWGSWSGGYRNRSFSG